MQASGRSKHLGVDDIIKRLRNAEFLRSLPEAVITQLASHSRSIVVARDALLFAPGDPGGLHLLVRGRVAILRRATLDAETELFTCVPGQVFGEVSLVVGHQINEARALLPTQALRCDRAAFWSAVGTHHGALLALVDLLARRAAAAEARVSEVALRSVKERVRLLLWRLAADARATDSDGRYLPEGITHEELGRLVGASREAVTRALTQLRREDAVVLRGRRIVVRPGAPAESRRD